MFSIPAATVRTRLFRARALLRESLARDMDSATVDVFPFAGERCDRIVAAVLRRALGQNRRSRGNAAAVPHRITYVASRQSGARPLISADSTRSY